MGGGVPIRTGVMLMSLLVLVADVSAQRGRQRSVRSGDAGRGAFAFSYAPVLTPEALAWYSRFDVLVTHDPLPPEQVARLHASGTKVLFYEWSVAFYDSRATTWQTSLLSDRRHLLNEEPLRGGAGSEAAAWYFDPASPQHEFGRVADILQRLNATGYDGVFFDTTTVNSVHPAARATYDLRHPDIPYDAAFSRFLAELRRQLPHGILFTNQGYRAADDYLPHVDWDLTESLITGPAGPSFQLRSWNDAENPWSSSHFVMERMIEPVAAKYPHVRFGHLNYATGSPAAIRVVVATARLFTGDGYVAAPFVEGEIDPIYLRNWGNPVTRRFDSNDTKTSWRFFERGVIVVTSSTEPVVIENDAARALRNIETGEISRDPRITIAATHGEPRACFFEYTQ